MATPIPNHHDIVQQMHARQPPDPTLDGALAFLLRLIARLQQAFPAERVGLLIKTAGENIVPYHGTSVSAGRIVYPDHDLLVKVLTDVPTTNGPSWQPEVGIPTEGHHGGYLAVGGGAPLPLPDDDPPDDDLVGRVLQLEIEFRLLSQRHTALETMARGFLKSLETKADKDRVEAINARFHAESEQRREYSGRAPLFGGTVISTPR